jgi:predicted negative regulator of RcsB-dependent stress response
MAAPSHRKVTRKALREPDEFVTTLDRILQWLEANLPRVIIGAVGVGAVLVVLSVLSFYSQHRQRLASEQFYRAINALSERNYHNASTGFSSLARNNSSSALGRLAEFYLATTYVAENQPSKARDKLRDYLADARNRLFRQMALTQLGVANEDLGDYRGAYAAYAKAAQLTGPERARARIGAARTLVRIGDRERAIASYQQFLRENPFSQQRAEVVEALAQLGAPPEPSSSKTGLPGEKHPTNLVRH